MWTYKTSSVICAAGYHDQDHSTLTHARIKPEKRTNKRTLASADRRWISSFWSADWSHAARTYACAPNMQNIGWKRRRDASAEKRERVECEERKNAFNTLWRHQSIPQCDCAHIKRSWIECWFCFVFVYFAFVFLFCLLRFLCYFQYFPLLFHRAAMWQVNARAHSYARSIIINISSVGERRI